MNNSMYEGLIVAAYITVFIAATTLTIFLFTSIQEYADKAYEYSNRISSGSLMEITIPTEEQDAIILRGDELISYYFNYIVYDAYTSNYKSDVRTEMKNSNNFNVVVDGISINNIGKSNLSYASFLDYINLNKKYSLKFTEYTDDKKTIEIKEAEVT